jgi:hypothetical protein
VTAHPIELIAGMDDGMDLDQKDQVTRHIAVCDACRTVARTMQRIDSLIAMPEPTLPLPKRATPREAVRVAGWASVVAVGLTLAVVVLLVLSFRQPQVTTIDTCGVLAEAARSAGVGAMNAKASPIKLPSPLAESWTACASGDVADRAGPWLLFRSRPTEGREVRALLLALTTTEPGKQLVFGNFSPARTTDDTERWITEDSTRASGTGRATAVLAEPYFFVVTAPSDDAMGRLAEAVLAELRQRPWPASPGASKTDACAVIRRAAPSAGLPTKDASGSPLTTNRHWTDLSVPYPIVLKGETWDNTCGFGSDESWHDPHLVLRVEPTTLQQAASLLSPQGVPPVLPPWVQIEAGVWLGHGSSSYSDCRDCPIKTKGFSAVAVFDAPHFFIVTQATDEAAIQLARAVLAELKRP